MSTNRLPPYPTGDLKAWATQLTEYLLDQQRTEQGATQAAPVALQHKIGDERAIQDGVLMFDPALNKVVVSINGVWRSATLDP